MRMFQKYDPEETGVLEFVNTEQLHQQQAHQEQICRVYQSVA